MFPLHPAAASIFYNFLLVSSSCTASKPPHTPHFHLTPVRSRRGGGQDIRIHLAVRQATIYNSWRCIDAVNLKKPHLRTMTLHVFVCHFSLVCYFIPFFFSLFSLSPPCARVLPLSLLIALRPAGRRLMLNRSMLFLTHPLSLSPFMYENGKVNERIRRRQKLNQRKQLLKRRSPEVTD